MCPLCRQRDARRRTRVSCRSDARQGPGSRFRCDSSGSLRGLGSAVLLLRDPFGTGAEWTDGRRRSSRASKPCGRDRHPIPCAPSLELTRDLVIDSASSIDAVVLAAQSGDAAAFATLYDAHARRVYALCLGMSGDRMMAAELVQDTFVRAWEGLGNFRGECLFATWLHRVAVNVMLDSDRRRRRRSLRVAIEADLSAPDDQYATSFDGAAPTNDVALSLDLEQAIARLPAGARAVFVLHDIGGYAHAEIAGLLGIAEGTSKAHLFRARRLLRGMLDR